MFFFLIKNFDFWFKSFHQGKDNQGKKKKKKNQLKKQKSTYTPSKHWMQVKQTGFDVKCFLLCYWSTVCPTEWAVCMLQSSGRTSELIEQEIGLWRHGLVRASRRHPENTPTKTSTTDYYECCVCVCVYVWVCVCVCVCVNMYVCAYIRLHVCGCFNCNLHCMNQICKVKLKIYFIHE